jgi:hypothetical protein
LLLLLLHSQIQRSRGSCVDFLLSRLLVLPSAACALASRKQIEAYLVGLVIERN